MSSLSVAAGIMLPRNMRTGGYDLPGVESSDVPLIGYRPLTTDSSFLSNQSGRGNDLETSQVSVFPFCLNATHPSFVGSSAAGPHYQLCSVESDKVFV